MGSPLEPDRRTAPVLSHDATPTVRVDGPVAFLEAVALFLRMIPLYPPGHVRVAAATERLLGVLHAAPGSTVVEVSRGGLRVRGEDAGVLGPGPAAFRTALLQTAVSRVTFEPDARPDAYVAFSRSLQRNVRLAGHGQVTFSDLWTAEIPGIRVEELRFRREGFGGGEGIGSEEADEASYAEALSAGDGLFGSGAQGDAAGVGGGTVDGAGGVGTGCAGAAGGSGDGAGGDGAGGAETDDGAGGAGTGEGTGEGIGGAGTGAGTGDGAGGGSGPPATPVASALPALRALLQADAEIRDLLERAERTLEETPSATLGRLPAGAEADFLEHLLRLLPIEVRSNPRQAREAVRRILSKFIEELARPGSAAGHRPQAAMLMQALWSVFPRRRDVPHDAEPPNSVPPPPAKPDPEDRDLAFLGELGAAYDDPARMVTLATAREPEIAPDDGILDLSSILIHAWLAEPVPERRDALTPRLVDALRARSEDAPPSCLRTHMDQTALIPLPFTDLERLARLARVAELAGLDQTPAFCGWLPEDVVVASFPRLLRAHVRAGGAALPVIWRVGRAQTLAAGAALLDPESGLATGLLDTVLAAPGEEAFWVLEAMLAGTDTGLHARAQRALRGRELPSIAAVALRAAPPSCTPASFLRVLAQDGANGTDSHRLDAEAIALLRHCIEDSALPASGRVYATASLAAFGMETAAPILRDLLRRRYGLLPVLPRDVRRQAKAMLKGGGPAPTTLPHALVPILEERA